LSFDLFNVLLVGVFFLLLISSVFVMLIRHRRLEKYLYISISFVCILLAMFRPIDIARDTNSYKIHVENTCKITECGLNQEIDYDRGYFFLLSVSKLFFEDYQALLFLAGVALAIKLFLIARMTSCSILSLYFYFSVFYLYHDITQFRVSAAIAFFLLALYLMDRGHKKFGVAAYGAAMLIHYQAIVASMVELANTIIARRYQLAIILVIISQLAGVINIVPPLSIIDNIPFLKDDHRVIQSHYADKESGLGIRGTNVLVILLLLVTVLPLKQIVVQRKTFDYCFSSVVLGYLFYWLFWAMPGSDRVLQFFWVPLAILVSLGRLHKPTYVATILAGAIFFMLTNFIAPILET